MCFGGKSKEEIKTERAETAPKPATLATPVDPNLGDEWVSAEGLYEVGDDGRIKVDSTGKFIPKTGLIRLTDGGVEPSQTGAGGLQPTLVAKKQIPKPPEAKSATYLKTQSRVRRTSALTALQIDRR